MPISIYDSIAGQVPRDYFLETEGPLASDDTFKCTPINLGAMYFESQTADYEIKPGEFVLADVEAGSGSFTLDLPAAPLVNQKVGVKLAAKTTVGKYVAINPNGKDIDGDSSNLRLDVQGWTVALQYDGAQWRIIHDGRFAAGFSVKHVKSNGSAGGTFTQDAWQTRELNTLVDPWSLCSLSSNELTLGPGDYEVQGSAPAYQAGNHQAVLYNETDSAVLVIGTPEYAGTAEATTNRSVVAGPFTLTAEKSVQLQHYCNSTSATNGFGAAAGTGVGEVYSILTFRKLR